MNRIAVLAALFAAIPASAQDELIPTHIAEFAKISATLRLRYDAGSGTLSQGAGGGDLDIDVTNGRGWLEGSVGLGMGFEAEISIPYQFQGTASGEAGGDEFEETTVGVGDVELRANYRLSDGNIALPQFMAGVILLVPPGTGDIGVAEFKTGGVTVIEGEDASPGDGVLQAGLQVGVSKKIAGAEIYGLVRAVVPTADNEDGDTEVDLPERLGVIVGADITVGGGATIDLRLTTEYLTEQVATTMGVDETEEANIEVQLHARLYYNIGGPATLIVGLGGSWIQDHAVDEESDLNLEQVMSYGLEVGLHLQLP